MDDKTKPITILKNLRPFLTGRKKKGVEMKKCEWTQKQGDGMGINENS